MKLLMEHWRQYLKEDLSITYSLPNFEYEWSEAKRYPSLEESGKDSWLEKANEGTRLEVTQEMLPEIGNTTARSLEDAEANFSNLEKTKQDRFISSFEGGKIEMPIVIKMDGKYDLLGGNTRYTGLVARGIMPTVWLVDLDSENNKENL